MKLKAANELKKALEAEDFQVEKNRHQEVKGEWYVKAWTETTPGIPSFALGKFEIANSFKGNEPYDCGLLILAKDTEHGPIPYYYYY